MAATSIGKKMPIHKNFDEYLNVFVIIFHKVCIKFYYLMFPKMDIKDKIKKVYKVSNIMTRSCYLSARGEVRNIFLFLDAGQI